MNDDQFEGKWNRLKGHVREYRGWLTDDVEEVQGKRQRMLARTQEKYGESKAWAEEKFSGFERRFRAAQP